MSETPKDKRAAALKRIKALSSKRASTGGPGGTSGGGADRTHPKEAPRHGTVGHRPQGG